MSGALRPTNKSSMKKKYLAILILFGLAVFALNASAAWTPPSEPSGGSGVSMGNIMAGIITFVWQFFAGLAVIMFIVAGIQFLSSNGDPAKITAARNAFIWGVVGVVVAIVAFSIVQIVSGIVK